MALTQSKVRPLRTRKEAILANAWMEDLTSLADAAVRISRTLERLLVLAEEARSEELNQQAPTAEAVTE